MGLSRPASDIKGRNALARNAQATAQRPLSIIWAQPAAASLNEILDYIGADAPDVPGALWAKLEAVLNKAAKNPEMYRHVPELGHTYREIVTVRPFRLVYRIEAEVLRVIALLRCEQVFDPKRFI